MVHRFRCVRLLRRDFGIDKTIGDSCLAQTPLQRPSHPAIPIDDIASARKYLPLSYFQKMPVDPHLQKPEVGCGQSEIEPVRNHFEWIFDMLHTDCFEEFAVLR